MIQDVGEVGIQFNLEQVLLDVVGRVDKLTQLIEDLAISRAYPPVADVAKEECGEEASVMAGTLYAFRRRRDDLFGPGLFADPSWDMMLDLFISREQGRHGTVSSVCVASAVPVTTALRYLNLLVDAGLVVRRVNEADHRVKWVDLSPSSHEAMRSLVTQWPAIMARSRRRSSSTSRAAPSSALSALGATDQKSTAR